MKRLRFTINGEAVTPHFKDSGLEGGSFEPKFPEIGDLTIKDGDKVVAYYFREEWLRSHEPEEGQP